MTLFKLRVPSKRSESQVEIFRLMLDDPIDGQAYKKLIERIESITGVGISRILISWNDGSDDCSIRNLQDLQDAVFFHEPGCGRNECILLKIQITETPDQNSAFQTFDLTTNPPITVTTVPTTPVFTTITAVPPSNDSMDSMALLSTSVTPDSMASPSCSSVQLPTYMEAATSDWAVPMDPPAYGDVTNLGNPQIGVIDVSKQSKRGRTMQSQKSNGRNPRNQNLSNSGSCPNLFKPPSQRPPYFFHPNLTGFSSPVNDRSLKKHKKKVSKHLGLPQTQRQNQSRQASQQRQGQNRGNSTTSLSEDKVIQLEAKLQEMGFAHERSVMERAIRSCDGDLNRIVDQLGCN